MGKCDVMSKVRGSHTIKQIVHKMSEEHEYEPNLSEKWVHYSVTSPMKTDFCNTKMREEMSIFQANMTKYEQELDNIE